MLDLKVSLTKLVSLITVKIGNKNVQKHLIVNHTRSLTSVSYKRKIILKEKSWLMVLLLLLQEYLLIYWLINLVSTKTLTEEELNSVKNGNNGKSSDGVKMMSLKLLTGLLKTLGEIPGVKKVCSESRFKMTLVSLDL